MTELDTLIRGIIIGICLLLAVCWLSRHSSLASSLGALFVSGVACYVLVSAPFIAWFPLTLIIVLHSIAIFNAVFFWWFVLALFFDDFRWQFMYWLPFLALLATLPFRTWDSSQTQPLWTMLIHQTVVIVLLSHALVLAVRDYAGDLVVARRRFRVALATLIPAIGLAIVLVEIGFLGLAITPHLLLLQAFTILVLAILFSLWALQPRTDLFAIEESASITTAATKSLPVPDQIELQRLSDLMNNGAYREPGLTVGNLAKQLELPEHRLRKLINEQLGYRNFNAYLNHYRIEAAKILLADPNSARQQIIQIAYAVGFNSIGPFNRAFRLATHLTPTEYRRQALVDFLQS